jgi:3,4-dihydroxy 2-butanone 4-phosphate synthase/GTP cyclohydrolase II
MQQQQRGVVVLLKCGETAEQLLAQFDGTAQLAHAAAKGHDLRNYGIGAQILRECGARKLHILGPNRRMPSMAGYDLEVVGFTEAP